MRTIFFFLLLLCSNPLFSQNKSSIKNMSDQQKFMEAYETLANLAKKNPLMPKLWTDAQMNLLRQAKEIYFALKNEATGDNNKPQAQKTMIVSVANQTLPELIAAAAAYRALLFDNGEANNTLLQNFGTNYEELIGYTDAQLQIIGNTFEQMRAAAQALIAQRAFLPQVMNVEQSQMITSLLANADGNIGFLELFNANNNPALMQIIRQYVALCVAHNADYPRRWDNEVKLRWDSLDTTQADINSVVAWRTRIDQMIALAGQSQGIIQVDWTIVQNGLNDKIIDLRAAFIRAEEKRADQRRNKKEPERENPQVRNNKLRNFSDLPLTSTGQGEANAIDPNDVIQGNIDDCPVISSLASLAANNAQSLLQMPDGRNRFTLTSARGKLAVYDVILFCRNPQTLLLEERTVSVTAKFYTDKQGNPVYAHDSANTTELWAMLYEKALAKLRGGYDGLNFSSSQEIAAMLTGRESVQTNISNLTDAEIVTLLQQPRDITTISSIGNAEQLGRTNNFNVPLVNNHAYRLEGIANNRINLNNPQGRNHIIGMTLADLKIYFNQIITNG